MTELYLLSFALSLYSAFWAGRFRGRLDILHAYRKRLKNDPELGRVFEQAVNDVMDTHE